MPGEALGFPLRMQSEAWGSDQADSIGVFRRIPFPLLGLSADPQPAIQQHQAWGKGGELSLVRSQNIDLVQSVADRLKASKSVVLADFRGLTVSDMTEVRALTRAQALNARRHWSH